MAGGLPGSLASAATATLAASKAPVHKPPPPFLAALPPGIAQLDAVTCASQEWCALAIEVTGKNNALIPTFAVTIDAGQSWYENAVEITRDGHLLPNTDQVTGLACPTVENCVVVGYNFAQVPVAFVTSDAGRSWQSTTMPPSAGVNDILTAVSCPSAQSCVAVGSFDSPLLSSDGGVRWQLGKPYPDQIDQLWGLSCPSAHLCRGLEGTGAPQVLLSTTDDGVSWTPSGSLHSGDAFAISCANAEQCVAMGTSNAYLTADGGKAWSAGKIEDKTGFESVACATSALCIAVGTAATTQSPQPVIAFTNNGGRTWG